MMDVRYLKQLISSTVRALFVPVRTHVPAQVTGYDGATNTCTVQPVIRKFRALDPSNMTTVDLPELADVPVMQRGSGKLWASCAPQVGSYGVLHISDRELEQWLAAGGVVDPHALRQFDISDAIFEPGLTPLVADGDNGLIEAPILTDRIQLRTRSGVTAVSVVDNETVEIKNEKCTIGIDVDGNVSIATEGTVTTSAKETILQDGTDYAVQFTAMKTAFDTLRGEYDDFVKVFLAHMHATAAVGPPVAPTPPIPPLAGPVPSSAEMDSAKIEDVRLP